MTAIVSSNTLGLFGSSLSQIGLSSSGTPLLGRPGQSNAVYVNSAAGNLVVQGQDEYLASLGLDTSLVRTYNSLGQITDDNGDNWRLNIASLIGIPATPNTVGSTLTKRFGDGAEILYTYDATQGHYVATDGAGAFDTLSYNATT